MIWLQRIAADAQLKQPESCRPVVTIVCIARAVLGVPQTVGTEPARVVVWVVDMWTSPSELRAGNERQGRERLRMMGWAWNGDGAKCTGMQGDAGRRRLHTEKGTRN